MAQNKELTIMDINDYLSDDMEVIITAYNIPLYHGKALNIPVGYCKYPITERMYIKDNTLMIELDC